MRQSHYMKWRFYFSLNLAHSAHEAVRPEDQPKVRPKLSPKFGPGWSQYLSLPSDANSAGFSSIATEDEQLREKQITFCVIIYRNRKLASAHAKPSMYNGKVIIYTIRFHLVFICPQWTGSMASIKNWAWNETASIFKVIHLWSRIHWESNILVVSLLEIDWLVFFLT